MSLVLGVLLLLAAPAAARAGGSLHFRSAPGGAGPDLATGSVSVSLSFCRSDLHIATRGPSPLTQQSAVALCSRRRARAFVGGGAAAGPLFRWLGRRLGGAQQLRLPAALQRDLQRAAGRLGPGVACGTDRRRHALVARHGDVSARAGRVRRARTGQGGGAESRPHRASQRRWFPGMAWALQLQAASGSAKRAGWRVRHCHCAGKPAAAAGTL